MHSTHRKSFIFTLFSSIILLAACDRTAPAQILEWAEEGQQTFTSTGGNGLLSFISSSAWTASCDAEWLTLSAAQGAASADGAAVTLTFEVGANGSYDSRTACVTISSEDKSLTATITQMPRFAIISDETEYSASFRGQTLELAGRSNVDLTASVASSCSSWMSCSSTKGMIPFRLLVTLAENTELSPRTGEIYLYDKASDTADTLTVTQDGMPSVLTQTAAGIYQGTNRIIGPEDGITQTAFITRPDGQTDCHIVNIPQRTYCLFRDMKSTDGSLPESYTINLQQNMSAAFSGKCCLNLTVYRLQDGLLWGEDTSKGLGVIIPVR